MTHRNAGGKERATPGPEQLRAQVEADRDKLGRTVEALAGKADIKGRARRTATEAKARARERTAEIKAQARSRVARTEQLVREETPDALAEKAGQAQQQIAGAAHTLAEKLRERTPGPVRENADRAVGAVRDRSGALIAGGMAAFAVLLIARCRRRR